MPLRPAPLNFSRTDARLQPARRGGRGASLALGACLAALVAGWAAQAQQGLPLRGTDGPGTAAQADPSPDDAMPEDAMPEDAGPQPPGQSLFDDPGQDGAEDPLFADPPAPEARAPSTRRAREAAAEEPVRAAGRAGTTGLRDASDEAAGEPGGAPNARATPERFAPDPDELEAPARTLREPPVEALPRVDALDEDPFAPVGLRAGTFILRPSLETGITASSNSTRTPGGSSGLLSETTLRLDAQSDWSEHSASINGAGTVRNSLSGDEVREVEGAVNAALTFDLGHDWRARLGAAYAIQPESPSDPEGVSGAETQPLNQSFEARAGLDKDLGRLRLSGTASVERDWYGEAELSDGGTVDQSSRDSTLALLTLRTGYQLSPAVTPFVEVEGGRRLYDDSGDADRSATRLGVRAGVALDLREKWKGELAAGWLRESFDDGDLDPIEGPSVSASLEWSPMRGTAVALNATTSVEGSTTEGESGSLVQDLRLDVERTLRANLSAEAGIGASWRDYVGSDGHDLTLVGELGLTWWLNRNLGLSGRLRHERLESNLPGREYRENSVFVGTKFQY